MPKTHKEVIGKENFLYKLDKNKEYKKLKDKKSVTGYQRKKGTKPHVNRSGNFHKQPYSDKRPPVICWNHNENHYARDCTRKKWDNIQEAIVGDVGKTQRIYATLEGRKEYHQSHMIEVACKIGNRTVSILIHSGASNIYGAPSVVLNCSLKKSNLEVATLYN